MKDKPDSKGEEITKIPFKSKVRIIRTDNKVVKIKGVQGHWKEVSYGTNKGWVFGAYLSKELHCISFINALKQGEMEGITISEGNIQIHLQKNFKADIDLHNNGIKGIWYINGNKVIVSGTFKNHYHYDFKCSLGAATKEQFNKCVKDQYAHMKINYGKERIPLKVTFILKPLSNSMVMVTGNGIDNKPVKDKKIFKFSFSKKFSCNLQ